LTARSVTESRYYGGSPKRVKTIAKFAIPLRIPRTSNSPQNHLRSTPTAHSLRILSSHPLSAPTTPSNHRFCYFCSSPLSSSKDSSRTRYSPSFTNSTNLPSRIVSCRTLLYEFSLLRIYRTLTNSSNPPVRIPLRRIHRTLLYEFTLPLKPKSNTP
jgi:hypothetical protein